MFCHRSPGRKIFRPYEEKEMNHPDVKENIITLPTRKSIRLPRYDYAQTGLYFVTVCTEGRVLLFGEIVSGEVVLSEAGRIVDDCIQQIPQHYQHVSVDEYVVMPDHVHVIVCVENNGQVPLRAENIPPLRGNVSTTGTIGAIMRGVKIGVTKWFRSQGNARDVWQRGFWERVIRDERELAMVREYIRTNPLRTDDDHDLSAMFDAHMAVTA